MKRIAAAIFCLALFLLTVPSVLAVNVYRGKIEKPVEAVSQNEVKPIDNVPQMDKKPLRYVIRKGDTLSGIARNKGLTVGELLQANKIANQDRILAGAILLIPDRSQTALIRTKKIVSKHKITVKSHVINGVEYQQVIEYAGSLRVWRYVGTDPNWKGNLEKDINAFSNELDQDLKKLAVKTILEEKPLTFYITSGMFFNQMMFGHGLWSNVVTDFGADEAYEARLYLVRYNNRIYCFVIPLVCNNISWFVLDEPEPGKPGEPEEPEGEELLTPPPPPPPPARKLRSEPPVVDMPHEPKLLIRCNNRVKATGYAGRYVGIGPHNQHDISDYAGADISYFPCELEIEDDGNVYRLGPSAQGIVFRGDVDRAVRYKGNMKLVGAELQRERAEPPGIDTLMAYHGRNTCDVNGIGFDYHSNQRNNMAAIEHNHVFLRDSIIFPRYELGGRYEFDLGGDKTTVMNGKVVPKDQDPRRRQNMYLVRGAVDLYDFTYVTPKVDVAGSYHESGDVLKLEPRLAAKLFGDKIEPGVSVQMNHHLPEKRQSYMAGAHVIVRPPVQEAFDYAIDAIGKLFSSDTALNPATPNLVK